MKLYRISIYDSQSTWSTRLYRGYIYFKSEQEAKDKALSLCIKPNWHYTVCEVQMFGE